MELAVRVCVHCRVLVVPAGGDTWQHHPEFAAKFCHSVCADPQPGREPSGSEARFGLGRAKTSKRDKLSLRGTLDALAVPPGTPVTVATDGSYKLTVADRVIKPMSWGFVATNGHYGLGTAIVPGKVVGGDRTGQSELRAIAAALQAIGDRHPITLISDSRDSLDFLLLWRDGHAVMPGGYATDRPSGRESTLAGLARRVRAAGDRLTVQWVRSHSGHPLNEGADALAKLARAWAVGRLDREQAAAAGRRAALTALAQYATDRAA